MIQVKRIKTSESTTSGAVASVSLPLGKTIKRSSIGRGIYGNEKGGNLLTGKKTNKKFANSIKESNINEKGSEITNMKKVTETTRVTDYNPKSQGGTRKELLAKYAKTKDPKDATAARKAGATQAELKAVKDQKQGVAEGWGSDDFTFYGNGYTIWTRIQSGRDGQPRYWLYHTPTVKDDYEARDQVKRQDPVGKFSDIRSAITAMQSLVKSPQDVSEAKLDEEDVIIVPGQGQRIKPGFIPKAQDHTDHEVEMAKSDLFQSAKNAKQIYELIKDVPETVGIEGWVQEKIIKANDYLNTVREYLEHKQVSSSVVDEAIRPGHIMGGLALVMALMGADHLVSAKQTKLGKALAIAAQQGDQEAAEHLKNLDFYVDENQAMVIKLANKYLHNKPAASNTKESAIIKGLLNDQKCPGCGGKLVAEDELTEETKKDACYHKVKSRYKVWPSAYASGALVQCRKKGASNWASKSK